MLAKNNKITKLISSLLIVAIIVPTVLFSTPKQTQAAWPVFDLGPNGFIRTVLLGTNTASTVTSTSISIKNVAQEVLKQIVMTVAKRFLQKMTTSTINWINSGFHGSPLFVQNPSSFFKDIAKFQIKDFVDMTGYDNSKFPFGKAFALSTIGAYKRQFSDNAQYTLSKAIRDPQLLYRFQTDFDIGGWNGFLINTQYPQNNYLGYRMLATEELANRLDGTLVSKANQVKDTLQQGLGFLSPKTCPTNPSYNNGKNEFQKPTFHNNSVYDPPDIQYETYTEQSTTYRYNPTTGENEEVIENLERQRESQASIQAREAYDTKYDQDFDKEKSDWAESNTCPGGLKVTTPGSVVGNQIMTALSSSYRQSELAMAVGTSISAIVDALLNKFIGDGLSALATKVNPRPSVDEWEYEGQKLGGPGDGTNDAWNMGPDEEVVLSEFKKQLEGRTIITTKTTGDETGEITTVTEETGNSRNCIYNQILKNWDCPPGAQYIPGDIKNTEAEIWLIDNPVTCNPVINTQNGGVTVNNACSPGLTQMLGKIWPQARLLDICQPGPDLGWQERLMNEMNRNSQKLQGKQSDSDGNKSAQADLALKELNFAVKFLKDWIINNMMTELPNSAIYMDAVDEIGKLAQQSDELTDRRRTRAQALVRLQAINAGLNAISTFDSAGKIIQPPSDSGNEKTLISLRKQYNANKIGVSNSNTVNEIQNDLFIAKEKLAKLISLTTQCNAERPVKGWSTQGGPFSTLTARTGSTTIGNTEKEIYCDAPIKGGYNHETFDHKNDDPGRGILGAILGGAGAVATGGISVVVGGVAGALSGSSGNPITHPEVPYVNANDVLKWRRWGGIFGNYTVDIELSCNIIWKANVLDYKGNLPGTTQIGNDYILPNDTIGSDLGTCSNVPDRSTGFVFPEESGITKDECNTVGGDWVPNEPLPQSEPNPQP